MSNVGIVYHTGTGYTGLLADAVAEGVTRAGAAPLLVQIEPGDIVDGRFENEAVFAPLDDCDAIVFGTPTYMGAVSAQLKAFMDASVARWYSRAWAGKVAAAFTVSATPSGDKLNALVDTVVFALQHGMIWVGHDESPVNAEQANRLGVYLGVAAQPDPNAAEPSLMAGDAISGEKLGARVAALAARLRA